MWLASSTRKQPAAAPRRRQLFQLEVLEDRCQPSAGALDLTFGSGGIVTTDIASSNDAAYAVLIQPDGKVLAGGIANNPRGDFGLARYLADGSLDSSFGSGGTVMTNFGEDEQLNSLAFQADGKIVAGGFTAKLNPEIGGFDYDFALARYNPDGSLDSSFGGKGKSAGKVTTNLAVGQDILEAVAIQPTDGRILAAGRSKGDIILARYNSNGSLDTSFGSGGVVRTDLGGVEEARAMTLTPGGNIIVAGSAGNDFLVARYLSDGRLDSSFGNQGVVVTPLDATRSDFADAVALQPDGRIVTAGTVFRVVDPETGAVSRFTALVRYDAQGNLDATFGDNGIVISDLKPGNEHAEALALDANGRLIVAAHVEGSSTANDFAVARYDSSGNLDPSFASGGLATVDFGNLGDDEPYTLDLQADGKIIVAGRSQPVGGTMRFALARFEGDPPPPPPPGITVTPTSGLHTSESGGTASFAVVLDTMPIADVIITIISLDETEGTVSVTHLVFTPEDWNVPQTVTITGVDDAEKDGDQSYTIELTAESTDLDYAGLDPDDVFVINKDNDARGGKK
jgi:uncharacterized delta-60 repeat protein